MAIIQSVEDGKLVDTSASANSSSATKESNTTLDKLDFLNLLVAEMQYQDPLEPQSNTDYVAQLATFSQVDGIENMRNSMESMQGENLVGKYVILSVTDSTTNQTTSVTGKVDYVTYEGGKIYLSVNDGLYSLDDLETVADESYMEASMMAITFQQLVASLPSVSALTTADATTVGAIRSVYDGLTSYQKQFIAPEDITKLQELEDKLTAWGVYGNTDDNSDTDSDTEIE